MTHFLDELEGHPVTTPTIPVRVVNFEDTEAVAPEYGAINSFLLTGATQPNGSATERHRILPQNERRAKAIIWVLPGLLTNNTLGYVRLGSRTQIENGQGGIFVSGCTFEWIASSPLYVASDGNGHELTVTVVEQQYKPHD